MWALLWQWRAMAKRKIAELDELATRLSQMRSILDASFNCECDRLEDCERLIVAKACCGRESGCRGVRMPNKSLARLRSKP
jgi:hypothetical protein